MRIFERYKSRLESTAGMTATREGEPENYQRDHVSASPHDTDDLSSEAERCIRDEEWPVYEPNPECVITFTNAKNHDADCSRSPLGIPIGLPAHDWRLDHTEPLIIDGKILSHKGAAEPASIAYVTCAKCGATAIEISPGADEADEDAPKVFCPRGYGFDVVMSPKAGKCDGCQYLREEKVAVGEQGPAFGCYAPSTEDLRDAEVAAGWEATP